MELDNDLVTQFAKFTKFETKDKGTTTVRGTVHVSDGQNYIHLDGADENSKTPVETTVELNEGDRVVAISKDHSIIVTGNETNPSVGTVTAGNLSSSIEQTAASIRTEVSANYSALNGKIDSEVSTITQTANAIRTEVSANYSALNGKIDREVSSIEQTTASIRTEVSANYSALNGKIDSEVSTIAQTTNAITTRVEHLEDDGTEFSEFKQTVEGFTFMGNGGTVKLTDGDIELTGAITWADLDSSTQTSINNAQSTANNAYDIAINNTLPSYIKSTYIDGSSVSSPSIRGGIISGAKFTNLTGTIENPTYNHWLEVGDSDGHYGFTFSSTGNGKIFGVYNGDFGFITLSGKQAYGGSSDILTHDAATGKTQAQGNTWDFSKVKVTGLPDAEVDPLSVWPVGSVYFSLSGTSPASYFGGTWEALQTGFLWLTTAYNMLGTTDDTVSIDPDKTTNGKYRAAFMRVAAWKRVG